jgi:hypothetical protein
MLDSTNKAPEANSQKGTEAPAPNHSDSSITDAKSNLSNLSHAKEQMAMESTTMVGQGVIPALRINDPSADASFSAGGFLHLLESSASKYLPTKAIDDVASGAHDEVVNHPGQCLEAAAKGAGITLLAAGVLAGAALIAPEAATAAIVVGSGLAIAAGAEAAVQLAEHVGGWSQDAKVVSNAQDYSPEKVAAANQDLKNVGANSAVIGSGVLGAAVAAPLATLGATSALDLASSMSANGGTVSDVLSRAVQNGSYQVQDVNGASVFMPRTLTVMDSLNNAVASGRYEPQLVNGITVLMPK